MVAIVDGHADGCVVIGAAAAAREGGRLVHDDRIVGRGKPNACGQASKAGADNVNGAGHQSMIPKSGTRFPAYAKPRQPLALSFDASAGEARSEKIMRKQKAKAKCLFNIMSVISL
jgi:hypothetical protein